MTHTHSDDAILAALQAGAVLTPAIAAEKWGCLALHSAISRLREQGYTITCTLRTERGRRFGSYKLTNAAQPSRPNSRVTEDSQGDEPSGAVAAAYNATGQNLQAYVPGEKAERPTDSAPVAPEIIHLNGQRYEVVFDRASAYDGTRYCSVREI